MKIFQIVHNFLPYSFAGTEVCTYNLAKELLKNNNVYVLHRINDLEKKEYEVNRGSYDGIKIYTINNTFKHYNSIESGYSNKHIDDKVIKVIDEVGPDIVHVQHLLFLSASFLKKIRKRNIPIIFSLHDYWYFCPRGQLLKEDLSRCNNIDYDDCVKCLSYLFNSNKFISQCYRLLKRALPSDLYHYIKDSYLNFPFPAILEKDCIERIKERNAYLKNVLNYTDILIAPSEFVRNKYVEFGLNPGKIIIIRNAVPRMEINRNSKTNNKKISFGYIGSIQPSKGIYVLIDAFNKIKDEKVELEIYGDLPDKSFHGNYYKFLKSKIINNSIHFKGGFNREDVKSIFVGIDVLIVPSIWNENCPTVILEALATKTPVIASDIGGIPELIKDRVSGSLFKVGDSQDLYYKIKEFTENHNFIESIRANISPPLHIDKYAELIEKLYRDTINHYSVKQGLKCKDPKLDNLKKMNFTQQHNREVNLFVANIIEAIIKQILPFQKQLGFISIILTGAFAAEEGTVIFNNREQSILGDIDFVLAIEKEIDKELEYRILKKISLESKKAKINHKIGLSCTPVHSCLNDKKYWALYDLRQTRKVLWGKDIFREDLRDIRNFYSEKFQISYQDIFIQFYQVLMYILFSHPHSKDEKNRLIYISKGIINCCTILLSLAKEYATSLQKRNENFKRIFPSYFPELFEDLPYLSDLFEKAVQYKLDPNKEVFSEPIDMMTLWHQAAMVYIKTFEYYLNRCYNTKNIEFQEVFKKFVNDKSESGWNGLMHNFSFYKSSLLWKEYFKISPMYNGGFFNCIKILKLDYLVSPHYIFYNAAYYLFLFLFYHDNNYLEFSKSYLNKIAFFKKQASISDLLERIKYCKSTFSFIWDYVWFKGLI